MNNEIYRKNPITFVWRCTENDRKSLKIMAAKKGCTMSDLLAIAWRFYVEKNNADKNNLP